MFRFLRKRREAREAEAAARKEQLRRKAGASAPQPLESLLPDQSVEAANAQLTAYLAGQSDGRHRHVVEVTSLSSGDVREFLDVNAPRARQHEHGIGAGSHSHTFGGHHHHHSHTGSPGSYDHSPVFDSSHSHAISHSHDIGSSFDSSGSSFDGGSSW